MELSHSPISWQSWIAECGPRFFLFARQQTRSEEDAADVLQETLVELWNRAPDHPPDPALVFATLRRRAIDLARQTTSRSEREKRWATESSPGESVWFEQTSNAESEKIKEALQSIRPEFAEVVLLKIWGELTFDQIATALAIHPSTAASRYRYGLQSLRLELAGAHTP